MKSKMFTTVLVAVFAVFMLADAASAYYSPRMGRFLNRDPIGETGAMLVRTGIQPATRFIPRDNVDKNGYASFLNNAISWFDPDGGEPTTQPTSQPTTAPTTQPEESIFPNSPAGGPSKHPKAVVCRASYGSLQITCSLGNDSVSCPIVNNTGSSNSKNGRTPSGEYLIDEKRTHPKHNIDWYNLYPILEDNSGYYGYTATTKGGRTTMGLHPGCRTNGCITVYAGNYWPYDSDPCWKQLSALLDKGKLTYTSSRKPNRKQSFVGFLWVE